MRNLDAIHTRPMRFPGLTKATRTWTCAIAVLVLVVTGCSSDASAPTARPHAETATLPASPLPSLSPELALDHDALAARVADLIEDDVAEQLADQLAPEPMATPGPTLDHDALAARVADLIEDDVAEQLADQLAPEPMATPGPLSLWAGAIFDRTIEVVEHHGDVPVGTTVDALAEIVMDALAPEEPALSWYLVGWRPGPDEQGRVIIKISVEGFTDQSVASWDVLISAIRVESGYRLITVIVEFLCVGEPDQAGICVDHRFRPTLHSISRCSQHMTAEPNNRPAQHRWTADDLDDSLSRS